jgi:hypothetical protein
MTTAALTLASVGLATPHAGKTLDAVKARGQVVCGVNTSGRVFLGRQPGQVVRPRRRLLPCRRRRRAQGC